MSGASEFNVQPSELGAFAQPAAAWVRAIPPPGCSTLAIAAISSPAAPDANNLAGSSPPSLLERYDVYSFAIGWNIRALNAAWPAPPNATVEMALLVNGTVRAIATDSRPMTISTEMNYYIANGSVSSDLVNPISLQARERLSLRVGFALDQAYDEATLVIGVQATDTAIPVSCDSTVSYRVIDLSPVRRI